MMYNLARKHSRERVEALSRKGEYLRGKLMATAKKKPAKKKTAAKKPAAKKPAAKKKK